MTATSPWLRGINADIAAGKIKVISGDEHRAQWEAAQELRAKVNRQTAERLASEMTLDQIMAGINTRTFGSKANNPNEQDALAIYREAFRIKMSARTEPFKGLLGVLSEAAE